MKIIIGGDFTTKYRGQESVNSKEAFDIEIKKLIQEADISVLNLESPVAFDNYEKIEKIGPCLRTYPESISYLKDVGFDVVTLANNHFYDYGEKGVNLTISELEKNGIKFVGGGRTKDEYRRILYLSYDNMKVALLNYCESEFSVNAQIGSNPINPINVFYDVQEAKKNADFIITITHGGHERYNLPSPRMQELYRFFIDLGIDVVVNHHQHCYSGYEKYHNGYIFYGLGNLFFDNLSRGEKKTSWNEGFLLQLNINIDKTFSFQIYPYEQCVNDKVKVSLLKDDSLFVKTLLELNSIISSSKVLEGKYEEWTLSQRKNQLSWFTPYSNRYFLALYRRNLLPSFLTKQKRLSILNMLRCESHRDLCIHLLKMDRY